MSAALPRPAVEQADRVIGPDLRRSRPGRARPRSARCHQDASCRWPADRAAWSSRSDVAACRRERRQERVVPDRAPVRRLGAVEPDAAVSARPPARATGPGPWRRRTGPNSRSTIRPGTGIGGVLDRAVGRAAAGGLGCRPRRTRRRTSVVARRRGIASARRSPGPRAERGVGLGGPRSRAAPVATPRISAEGQEGELRSRSRYPHRPGSRLLDGRRRAPGANCRAAARPASTPSRGARSALGRLQGVERGW